jgi:DNA mismatch repair protein MutL
LYEQYLTVLDNQETYTQKELFAKNITLSPVDAAVLTELLPQINQLGFDIRGFGNETFVIHGVPANLKSGQDEQKVIETLLEQYKRNTELKLGIQENIARSMARSAAIKRGQNLTVTEMKELIDKLFACLVPFKSPTGRNCFLSYDMEELENRFKNS